MGNHDFVCWYERGFLVGESLLVGCLRHRVKGHTLILHLLLLILLAIRFIIILVERLLVVASWGLGIELGYLRCSLLISLQ